MAIASGCKQETDENGSQEKPEEKVISEEQEQETRAKEQATQLVFDLEEVSLFSRGKVGILWHSQPEALYSFLMGMSVACDEKPGKANAVIYPRFKSDKPLYGSIQFSGEIAGIHQKDGHQFVTDESAGTGTGYNRLYFDHDCDLDLTKEEPLMSLKILRSGSVMQFSSIEQQVGFDSFDIIFDYGSAGEQAIEIMPRLRIIRGRPQMSFVATKIRKGKVEIAGIEYIVLLGYGRSIGRRFDHEDVVFSLIPERDPENPPSWTGAERLNSTHAIGGKHYRFATTPTGDKLFVRSYRGALGTFEVGTGGRDILDVTMRGILRSEDTSLAVGGELKAGWPKPAKSCQVPVGDYLPSNLKITFGRLSISISSNYHSDGKPREADRPKLYAIKIRKDEPYIFDFSNEPDVIFASPAKDHRVKLGEELQVNAVLIDPELDIMIRRLYDTGTEQMHKNVSLDPKVIITRADGEKVAEGVMPFG